MTKIQLKKIITDKIDWYAARSRCYKEMLDNSQGDDIVNITLNEYYKGMVCAYMNVLSIIDLKNSSSPEVIMEAELHNIQQSNELCSKE